MEQNINPMSYMNVYLYQHSPAIIPDCGNNWQIQTFPQIISSEADVDVTGTVTTNSQEYISNEIEDTFGLEFAAVQWLNLVSNAESLFNKLLNSILLSGDEKEQIQKWLCLKQECEECVVSEVTSLNEPLKHSLECIEELTEDTEELTDSSEKSIDSQYESETESDFDSHHPEFEDKLIGYMEKFKDRTDVLIQSKLTRDDFCEEIDDNNSKSASIYAGGKYLHFLSDCESLLNVYILFKSKMFYR